MLRIINILAITIIAGTVFGRSIFGQSAASAILQIDIENWVEYVDDNADTSKWAINPSPTPASVPKNFTVQFGIADIVAVNGEPVKGTMVRNLRNMNLSSAPNPGQAIGDAPRGAAVTDYYEIMKTDGTPIGTIIVAGLAPGPAVPGAPLAVSQGNFAVIGGTGAYFGVRGQSGQMANPQVVTLRQASITEDPANRRQNGGGRVRWIMQLTPLERPEIIMTPSGPAVAHSSDFTMVTSSKPAAAGEVLSLFMTGLGPTKPGVDPGSPFPPTPATVANSPVRVTVNGESAEVLGAVGYPGSVDGYQVNFRVPADVVPGTASIQVSAAWIAGPKIQIAIH